MVVQTPEWGISRPSSAKDVFRQVGRRLRTERPSPRALRRDILAVLEQPRYRETSRRIAAEMVAAPGFACLADVVDKLTGTTRPSTVRTCSPVLVEPENPRRKCEEGSAELPAR